MTSDLKKVLKKAENVLAASEHDLLVSLVTEVKWMKKNQYFLWLVLLTLEGIKILSGGF